MKHLNVILGACLLLMVIGMIAVSADTYSGGVDISPSKYVGSPSTNPVDLCNGVGHLYIGSTAEGYVDSSTLNIWSVSPKANLTWIPVVTNRPVQKNLIDAYYTYNGDPLTVQINGAGAYDTDLVPGTYAIELVDGNAHPEYALAQVTPCQDTKVTFIGHAAATNVIQIPSPVNYDIHICLATYGPDLTDPRNPTGFGTPLKESQLRLFKNWIIVTSEVKGLLGTGDSFTVPTGGFVDKPDPAYGWYKDLTVVYTTGTYDCDDIFHLHTAVGDEGSPITFA